MVVNGKSGTMQKGPMIRLSEDEAAQGMVEYLLIVGLVVLTIVGLFAALMRLFS